MRKLVLAQVLILSALTAGFSSNIIKVSVDNKFDNAFVVKLNYDEAINVSIRIVNDWGGEIIKNDFSDVTTFIKRYRLLEVEEGIYNVIITSGDKSTVQPIMVKNDKVTVDGQVRSYYKPSLKIQDDHLLVNMLAFTEKAISFQLLDNRGEVIYSNVLKGDIAIKKMFDLINLPTGYYFVRLHNNDVDYTYNFKK